LLGTCHPLGHGHCLAAGLLPDESVSSHHKSFSEFHGFVVIHVLLENFDGISLAFTVTGHACHAVVFAENHRLFHH
jgi:hypothetical protein